MFDDGGEVEKGGGRGEGGSVEQPASSHQAPSPPPSTSWLLESFERGVGTQTYSYNYIYYQDGSQSVLWKKQQMSLREVSV